MKPISTPYEQSHCFVDEAILNCATQLSESRLRNNIWQEVCGTSGGMLSTPAVEN